MRSERGNLLDWHFMLRLQVQNPRRFTQRVLGSLPFIQPDQIGLQPVSERRDSIQSEIQAYREGDLQFGGADKTAVRRLWDTIAKFCSDQGLALRDFDSVRVEPSKDLKQVLETLGQIDDLSGEKGKANLIAILEATKYDDSDVVVQKLESAIGISDLLKTEEQEDFRRAWTNAEISQAADVIVKAIERTRAQIHEQALNKLPEDEVPVSFLSRVAALGKTDDWLVTWSRRLRQLGYILIAAISVAAVLWPELVPQDTTAKLIVGILSLLTLVISFLVSEWLEKSHTRRIAESSNTISIVKEDALLRAQIELLLNDLIFAQIGLHFIVERHFGMRSRADGFRSRQYFGSALGR